MTVDTLRLHECGRCGEVVLVGRVDGLDLPPPESLSRRPVPLADSRVLRRYGYRVVEARHERVPGGRWRLRSRPHHPGPDHPQDGWRLLTAHRCGLYP